jgi:hypothetical protein
VTEKSARRVHLSDLVAVILICGVLAAMFASRRRFIESQPYVFCIAVIFAVWQIARSRRSPLICDECGQRFYPSKAVDPSVIPAEPAGPRTCPSCSGRQLRGDQADQEQSKAMRSAVLWLAILLIMGTISGVMIARNTFTSAFWSVLTVSLLPALVVAALLWWLTRSLIRTRTLQALLSEEGTLAGARRCAGEEGAVAHEGSTMIWHSGPDDPLPMLREEISAAHHRVKTLLGVTGIPDPPVRILCFHDFTGLLKFYETYFRGVDLTTQLGIFLKRPWNIAAFCSGIVPGRLDDSRASAGSLYDQVLLEQVYRSHVAPWVQFAVPKAVAACERPADLVRLNRRMIAALSGGLAWSEELFSISQSRLSKFFPRGKDPHDTLRGEQFGEQAWSVFEHLCGRQAPEARKADFQAFLKDQRSTTHQEESFFQHFGFGFGSLLDTWRQWVLDQGIGAHEPPTSNVRDALINRLLPVIQDRGAPRPNRIQAIRDWRKAGFVLGADALIELLRQPGDIPKQELIWSLRIVSGKAWDDAPDQWQAWWDELAPTCNEPAEPTMMATDRSLAERSVASSDGRE